MADQSTVEWVLPASIPFSDLKARDLEECLYWLFDAMGAKDLEWRTGGGGAGAADGGRDLEARFYTPGADNEIESQTWWIECKGRSCTVEPDEVKSAVLNAQVRRDLDYVVIATNTQFSNPTRDWVTEWQTKSSRPKVKLWDHAHLERLLSRHPEVVLRLFSEALSLQGRLQAMESRFWNKLEFVTPRTLAELWKSSDEIQFTTMAMFAVTVNEFANGSIIQRPWGANLKGDDLLNVLLIGLLNTSYLMLRSSTSGTDTQPIIRAFAYLILCAIDIFEPDSLAPLILDSLYRGKSETMPESVREFLLMPIVDQLLSEMQDVCSSDCRRISRGLSHMKLTKEKDEVEDYWLRLDPKGAERADESRRFIRIERHDAPCVVGFPVDKDNLCPLFRFEPRIDNLDGLLAVIKRVAAFRKAQAAEKRQAETARRGTRT